MQAWPSWKFYGQGHQGSNLPFERVYKSHSTVAAEVTRLIFRRYLSIPHSALYTRHLFEPRHPGCYDFATTSLPILMVLMLAWVFPVSNLRAGTTYNYRQWKSTDGLPHNTVQSLCQTPAGYLWVGTFFGLARFDGVRFMVFNVLGGVKEAIHNVLKHSGAAEVQFRLWYENGHLNITVTDTGRGFSLLF